MHMIPLNSSTAASLPWSFTRMSQSLAWQKEFTGFTCDYRDAVGDKVGGYRSANGKESSDQTRLGLECGKASVNSIWR